MRGKEIIFETTESGCIVPTSHKLNQDGYFRTRDLRVPAKEYWLSTKCSGITLCKQFGVSFSTACKWIREWKV